MASTVDFRAPLTGWTTADELKFLFGSPCYPGLVNQDMTRINNNRALLRLAPVSRGQLLDMYTQQLDERRWDAGIDVGTIKFRIRQWRAEQLLAALPRAHKDVI